MSFSHENYSILMSVYHKDSPEYLEAAVKSMLDQSVPPEQFVIVKDGPLPRRLDAIITAFSQSHPELFTVISKEENEGLARALNDGLGACRNSLVARMDADDISLPSRCEKELVLFEKNPGLAVCGCQITEFTDTPDDRGKSRIVPADYDGIKSFMRRRQAFNHPTVMYRKEKVLECGGYGDLRRKEDFDLFSRMIGAGFYALNVDEVLYLYRINDDNLRRRKSLSNFTSALKVYRMHFKRKGCSLWDLTVMSCAEFVFLIAPMGLTKHLSEKFLRK